MANDIEYEAGAPKKADVLIRSTQHIALKQEELEEQLKLAVGRIEEAMELFTKSNQDSSYIVKQSGDIFSQLQSENAVLKQELLYLAKQSENIYSGLAEKITELTEKFKSREESLTGMADKVNDVASQASNNSELLDRLTEISERSKRNEDTFDALAAKIAALSEKLDTVSERTLKSERTINERLSAERNDSSDAVNADVMSKLNHIAEQLRRSEGAHSMLADKFEILSMRVEQFGFESAKASPTPYQHTVQPVAYPAPVQTVVKQDIDYDMLANKVADLLSAREAISPDYIASKVAEQIVLPEIEASQIRVNIDADRIARQVAELVDVKPVAAAPANVAVNIDEEALAARIASKVSAPQQVIAQPSDVSVNIDEESLAERIAGKLGGIKAEGVTVSSLNIDTEELVDAIALKVGSLKSEDFEILVDDEGCTSISREIANKLDYKFISDVVADKIRDALDIAAANAPDYEDMAERISEKITVAGINEDSIADKAAAVLSNYLPEFDVDEIADKVTGAVIDVVSAMPQPTVDSETICNTITERLIESQEDHDYDIVIDDDGISRITELVTEKIESQTGTRFDKVEEQLTKLNELLTPEEIEEQDVAEDEIAVTQDVEEKDYTELCGLMAEEIQKSTAHRFDKVEEDIAKLADIVSGIVVEEEPEVEYEDDYDSEPDYAKLSEVVATEIERGVSSRLDSVEENISKLAELLTVEEQTAEEEQPEVVEEVEELETAEEVVTESEFEKTVAARFDSVDASLAKLTELLTAEDEEDGEEYEEVEEDYSKLTEAVIEAVAAEVEKVVSEQIDVVREDIGKLTELVSGGEETEIIEEAATKQDYTALTQSVAEEVERVVSVQLDGVREEIGRLAELVSGEETEIIEEAAAEQDYTALTQSVAEEVEKAVAARLDSVEENISKIAELIANGVKVEQDGQQTGVDLTDISRIVAAEMLHELDSRLEKVESDLGKITDYVEGDIPVETDSRIDRIAEEIGRLSTYMEGELSVETAARLEKLDNNQSAVVEEVEKAVAARLESVEASIAKLTEALKDSTAEEEQEEDYTALSQSVAEEVEKTVASRLDGVEENISKLAELVANGVKIEQDGQQTGVDLTDLSRIVAAEMLRGLDTRLEKVESDLGKITDYVEGDVPVETDSRIDKIAEEIGKISTFMEGELSVETAARLEKLENEIAKISEAVNEVKSESVAAKPQSANSVEDDIAQIKDMLASGVLVKESSADMPEVEYNRLGKFEEELAEIKEMLANGVRVNEATVQETAAAQAAAVEEEDEEEQPLVTVSEVVEEPEIQVVEEQPEEEEFEEEEEEEDDDDDKDDDFLIDVLDTDGFSDNELMPGEMSDYSGGVDFENMMKFKRSFIARIIQSRDEYKQYYGEVKHALLSYKKVNSNVAWGNERFNKGRETIARMKIRGKTLVVYLALDPNNYKTSVYHHLDVSDNKSVAGTPMMIKVKSNLGVKKAIRLIDEMLALRNGEKKEIPERDYAAMYPYETIEELIEEGLVKDVRKK